VIARRIAIIVVHLAAWTASVLLAFSLRFEFQVPPSFVGLLTVWIPTLLIGRTAVFHAQGLFRGLWRYSGARDAVAILQATTISSLLLTAALVVGIGQFPRSIIGIEWFTAVVLVGGIRFAARALRRTNHHPGPVEAKPQRLLVVGAGDAGEMLVREILKMHRDRYRPVGFVDDDPGKRGAHIHGIRVIGSIPDIPRVAIEKQVDEIVIAIPTATGQQMRRVVDHCKSTGVRFKTIPGLDHIIDGRVRISQIRDVDIEDLLGRAEVRLDAVEIEASVARQVVMVTGAGGSIGSEICRQLLRFGPSLLVLVERAENNLFHVHRELATRQPDGRIVPCVADVTDATRMVELFRRYRPQVLYHAAAHKHVPMMEWNPGEAVKNNVLGTKTLADLASRFEVGRFVMISTDKAVNPTSVMGVSKRVAEIYVQALSQRSPTRFVTVRFGNVLGSAGSVIPIFKEQIASGGPVTVTHPDMKRYFMTIPEASQLVLQAGAMGAGGEIFILDMGEPVRIGDLARELITLSGLKVGEDIEIRFTGVRPGEKLFEEIAVTSENADKTRHPKIFVGRLRPHPWEALADQLQALAAAEGVEEVRRRFAEIVPEYRPTAPVDTPTELGVPPELRRTPEGPEARESSVESTEGSATGAAVRRASSASSER
jgi:FlaA1/EpsC-like NDP-sugar epimerase